MSIPHPYMSGTANLVKLIVNLREKGLPKKFSKSTLKRAEIPLSYTGRIINALKFVGIIGEKGKFSEEAIDIFSEKDTKKFAGKFNNLIENAYSSLFKRYSNSAWSLDREKLTKFFSKTDKKAEIIAEWQAKTFIAFAYLARMQPPASADPHKPAQLSSEKELTKKEAKNLTEAERLTALFAQFIAEKEDTIFERNLYFEGRDIHPEIASASQELFDNAHYPEATFRACKILEEKVRQITSIDEIGVKLMNQAFNKDNPKLLLSDLEDSIQNENEQEGYRSLFYGIIKAIRNPRAHGAKIEEDIEKCLNHLSLASMLMRKLDDATRP